MSNCPHMSGIGECDRCRITSLTDKLSAAEERAAAAEARCKVLADEVRAWRYWKSEDGKVGGDDEVDANANQAWGLLECDRKATDAARALEQGGGK